MRALRRVACVFALAAASFLASPAYATSFTTDQSDLWYIQAESGWGIQLVQRGSVIFATLFVYGPSGTTTWYVATMSYVSGFVWSGTLYQTTGPYFATVPFNPLFVTATPVGTMTWQAQTVETGTLTYVVNGVTIIKDVVRQQLVFDDFSGHFAGGIHDEITGCPNPAANGTFDLAGVIDVSQAGTAMTIQSVLAAGATCTYMGTLSQAGQMGSITGASFSCTDGSSGTITFDELQVTISGLTGRFEATYAAPLGCQASGWFGGFRGTTF